MANYSYIDTSGNKQTVTANDSASALSSAKNLAKDSGVMLDTNVITPASLTPVTTIPVVTPTVTVPNTSVVTADINSGVTQAEKAYQDQLANAKSMASEKAKLESLVGAKGADTVNTYNSTGVNDLFSKLKDIQARSTGLVNEATAVPIQTQQRNANTGATDAGVAPQNAGALRENALKQLALGQEYAIASGNYEKAKNYADQIITAKYDQLDADIKAKQTNLDALKEFDLTPAQKKLADAQQAKLTKEANELAEKKANEKTMQDIALTAAQNGATQEQLKAITDAKDFNSAVKAAGNALVKDSKDIIKLDNGNTLLIDKNTGKIIKDFGGIKSTNSTDTTSAFQPLVGTVSNLETTVAGKQAVASQMAQYIKNQDWAGAYNQVANTVENSLTGTTKTRYADARIDYEVMSGLKNAVQQFADAGGDTGLLTGTAEQITRKLGRVKDPALTALAVELQREFQAYRNTMTGAAFTPKESREYDSVNPSSGKSINLNVSVIDGAMNQLKNRVDSTIKAKVPQASSLLQVNNSLNQTSVFSQAITSTPTSVFNSSSGWVIPTSK